MKFKIYSGIILLLLITLYNPLLTEEVQLHFDRGNSLLETGSYDEAIKEFLTAAEIDSSYTYFCYYLAGECYERKGNYNEAVRYYRKAMEYTNLTEEKVKSHYAIAHCYHFIGEYKKAVEEIIIISEISPSLSYDCYMTIGSFYREKGDFQSALNSYEEALNYAKNTMDKALVHIEIGYSLLPSGNYEEAAEEFNRALELNSNYSYPVYFGLGDCYKELGEYKIALIYYKKALNYAEDEKQKADIYVERGNIYLISKDTEKGKEEFKKALNADPDRAFMVYFTAGSFYMDKENFKEALNYYKKAVTHAKNDMEIEEGNIKIGYCNIFLGNYDEAIKLFEALLDKGGEYKYSIHFGLAVCYKEKEDYQKALKHLQEGLKYAESKKEFADIHAEVAFCHMLLGNRDKAIEYAKQSVEYYPTAQALYFLGDIYVNSGLYEYALKSYKECLGLLPEGIEKKELERQIEEIKNLSRISSGEATVDEYISTAKKFYFKGACEDAIEVLRAALSIAPESVEIHAGLARCYDELGFEEKALEEYETIIKLDPKNALSYYYCGELVFRRKDFPGTLNYLKKAAFFADSDELMLKIDMLAASSYFELEEYDKAIDSYEKIIYYLPEEPVLYYSLGNIYYKLGDKEKALQNYKKCLKLDPYGNYVSVNKVINYLEGSPFEEALSSDEHIKRGLEYEQKGNYTKAEEEYEKALEIDSSKVEAHNNLGIIYLRDNKDFPKASYHFLSALEIDPENPKALYNMGIIYELEMRYEEAIEKYEEYIKTGPENNKAEEVRSTIVKLKNLAYETEETYSGATSEKIPIIEILEPASLIGEKNLYVEEKESEVIKITAIVSSNEEIEKVTVNGQPVKTGIASKKNMELSGAKKSYNYQFTAEVSLDEGKNIIDIEAWDALGNPVKTLVTVNYNPGDVITEAATEGVVEKSEKWAVVIGVGRYQNPAINKLDYTISDAEAIYNFLITKGGFKEDHVKLLLDSDATTKNIKSALGVFLPRKAMENDTVFIYYSGHGAPEIDPASTDADGTSKYIVTYDSDPQELYATAFPMDEIKTIFQRIEAKKIAFFIDSCYSGATGGRTFSRSGMKWGEISEEFLDDILEGEGRVIITASGTNEVSMELAELNHGIFTYHLLKAINGEADANGDRMITIDEIYDYVYENVLRDSRDYGGCQHPMKKGESTGKFILINY